VKWARREKSSAGFHFLGAGGVTVDAEAFPHRSLSASKPFRVQPLRGNRPVPTLRSQCEAARASRLRERRKSDRQRA
jgi:hypothetical protein